MNMKTDHIMNARKVGGDYFRLIYVRASDKKLEDYLLLFNFDDYWCFKTSNKFMIIDNIEEFKSFKYSGYTFFRKDLYDKDLIIEWSRWSNEIFNGSGYQYLVKPSPPFNPNKIIIRK